MDKRKIKVMIVTPSLECGGGERFVSLLCNNIDLDVADVSLVVVNNKFPFYNIRNEVPVINLGVKKVSMALFRLKKAISLQKPDIVFTTANHLNLLIGMFKWMMPAAPVYMARETSVVSINSQNSKWPKLYNFLLRRFYKRLDHIVCQSEFMRQDLMSGYNIKANRSSVIKNAVDPSLTYYDGPVKEKSYITVARLSKEKGIARIINALAMYDHDFVYNIVGSGPEELNLKALAESKGLSSKVFFHGTKQEPFTGLEGSSLYLAGSYHEGFPNSILEANALGIPVLAFNAPGVSELVSQNGLLARDEHDFSKQLRNFNEHSFDREIISNNSRNEYSIGRMTDAFQSLFFTLRNY